MAPRCSPTSKNNNFVRVNVHNSSWRPPGYNNKSTSENKPGHNVKIVKNYIFLTLIALLTVTSGSAEAVLPSLATSGISFNSNPSPTFCHFLPSYLNCRNQIIDG